MGGILKKAMQHRRAVRPKDVLLLSLKPKDSGSTEWFVFLDNAKVEALNKRYVPKNTEKNTQWTLSTFRLWRDKRNEHFREEPDKQVPADLLASTDKVILCKWLSLFVAEVRKKDGTEYPPKTVYIFLAGINRCYKQYMNYFALYCVCVMCKLFK